jgi:hypothetical protein
MTALFQVSWLITRLTLGSGLATAAQDNERIDLLILAVSLSLGNVPSQTRLESFIPHNEINDIYKINNVSINSAILPQGYTMPWARHVASPTCRFVKNPFTG